MHPGSWVEFGHHFTGISEISGKNLSAKETWDWTRWPVNLRKAVGPTNPTNDTNRKELAIPTALTRQVTLLRAGVQRSSSLNSRYSRYSRASQPFRLNANASRN